MSISVLLLLAICWTRLVLRGHGAMPRTSGDTFRFTEYEIAYPVAWDGEQNEHIPLHQLHALWRKRRSTQVSASLHVNLTVFGHDFHLQLWENKGLLAPGFKIYRRRPQPTKGDISSSARSASGLSGERVVHEDLSSRSSIVLSSLNSPKPKPGLQNGEKIRRPSQLAEMKDVRSEMDWTDMGMEVSTEEEVDLELSCQLTGRVRSHGDTPVALSVCRGMNGMMRVAGQDYIIEPAVYPETADHPTREHSAASPHHPPHHLPHRVYRRSSIPDRNGDKHFHGSVKQSPVKGGKRRPSTSLPVRLSSISSPSSTSSPLTPSFSAPATNPDSATNFLRNTTNSKHYVHYVHDSQLDSVYQVPSNTVDQFTKLQQYLLRVNNDFRESDQARFGHHHNDIRNINNNYNNGDNVSVSTVTGNHIRLNVGSVELSDVSQISDFATLDEKSRIGNSMFGLRKSSGGHGVRRKSYSVSVRSSMSDHGEVREQKEPTHSGGHSKENGFSRNRRDSGAKGKTRRKEGVGGSRRKRSARKRKYRPRGNEKTMEMLVVVDKSMTARHGTENITPYTLTLFNMVSRLFQDTSLGSRIKVTLVALVLLEGDEPGLTISHHADRTLKSFCSWQSTLSGSGGRQHDHAVLLSATDFCSYKNSPCDTLGFAPIGGMCNPLRSCTINEDTGLNTALTIAHEIGHNFGMQHDGEGNYCRQTVGSIMAPTLVGKDGTMLWSVCSRAYLLRFLNTPQAACLHDQPKQVAELTFPDQLPGQLYDADIQCKWQFGSSARVCQYDFGKDTCKALWCYRGNKRCETKFLPAAEGTSCGAGKWCRDGRCQRYGRDGPRPVHGAWSAWSRWTDCTRSCGTGVQTRQRQCNRPLPQYGGRRCFGDDKFYRVCNVQDCPDGKEDSRSVQCSQYDRKPFRGWYMHWKPYNKLYDEREPCKLYCVAETLHYIFTLKHVAVDGTPCPTEDSAVCIAGSCQPFGCDLLVNSTAKTDACGVCKGDNQTCEFINGEYSKQPKLNTYFPIVVLPKGAGNIYIRERTISSNYLAIRNIYGQYYLNGDGRMAWPGLYTLAAAPFQYRRPYNEPETLHSPGPLGEDIILEILVQDTNPGIQYQYTLPRSPGQVVPPAHNYTWSHVVSPCSQSCAGGVMTMVVRCVEDQQKKVDDELCDQADRPHSGTVPCHVQPCPARWEAERWSNCSKTCGGGWQTRKMLCKQRVSETKDRRLRRRLCKHLSKPATRQRCNNVDCLPQRLARWVPEDWSPCSKSCGGGQQVRRITCRRRLKRGKDRRVGKRHCRQLPKPAKRRHCNTGTCPPTWHAGRWSKCSVLCGKGRQVRTVSCRTQARHAQSTVADRRCNGTTRPSTTRVCQRRVCHAQVSWGYSAWGECSATCGNGREERQVWCGDGHSQLSDSRCAHLSKPPSVQICHRRRCPSPQPMARMAGPPLLSCVDKEQWCPLVRQHKACGHAYYKERCCHSCRGG